jgi:hypothetical protein
MVKLKIIYILGVFLVFSFCVRGEEAERIIEYDFGRITADVEIKHLFELEGEIKSAVSLCDCVQAGVREKEIVALDREIGIQEEREISVEKQITILEIRFDPRGYDGEVYVDVMLLDKDNNLTRLRLKSFVVSGKQYEQYPGQETEEIISGIEERIEDVDSIEIE